MPFATHWRKTGFITSSSLPGALLHLILIYISVTKNIKGISYRICGLIQLYLFAPGVYRNGNTLKGS